MKPPPLISDYLLLTSVEKALVARQRAIDIEHYTNCLSVEAEASDETTRPMEQKPE